MRAYFTPTYGSPDILEMRETAAPEIGPEDYLVRNFASPITEGDRRMRAGDFPGISAILGRLIFGFTRPRYPILGTAFAGEIIAAGPKAVDFRVGDRIFGTVMHGAYAEKIRIQKGDPIAALPDAFEYNQGAILPYGALTAFTFLTEMSPIQSGDEILIVGASGAVGYYATQLAKAKGAQITALCSAKNADIAREAGAHRVYDYRETPLGPEEGRYDIIFDTADALHFGLARPHLKSSGRYLTLAMGLRNLFDTLRTRFMPGPKAQFGLALGDKKSMEAVAQLAQSGVFRPRIDRIFAFESMIEAQAYQAETAHRGAVLVGL